MRPTRPYDPSEWGLHVDPAGQLCIGPVPLVRVAGEHGTPVHVVHADRLTATALAFRTEALDIIGPRTRVQYAFKCNPVAGVVAEVRSCGFGAEVMTPLELELAVSAGYDAADIVVNGPCKTRTFLEQCVAAGTGLIVVDGLRELDLLASVARASGRDVPVLLRVNPDIVPRGMNAGSATGSRTGCAFGLDLKAGEVHEALRRVRSAPLRLRGFHAHVGTGLRSGDHYRPLMRVFARLFRDAEALGCTPDIVDAGGGFPSRTSRAFTGAEMLLAQAFGAQPRLNGRLPGPGPFFDALRSGIDQAFGRDNRPLVILEPGRVITSNAQCLLLRVHAVKRAPNAPVWVITDGGLGTVTLPTFYELHALLACDGAQRPYNDRVTVTGPGCFAADVVARNVRLPRLREGDVIAVMDSGAYFTSLESTFGHPRPAVVAVRGGRTELWRRRETPADVHVRDVHSSVLKETWS